MQITVDDHPVLDARVFVTSFPQPLGELSYDVSNWLSLECNAPLSSSDAIRRVVRNLLRHGGFKPTGRSKPASEYLIKAVTQGALAPINAAVDVCNVASLHSGLPISVVDLERAEEPFRISTAPADTSYVFNTTGQTIKLDGLVCLFDAVGPCANAVKDCQRTKTSESTRRTLSVIWGTKELPGHTDATFEWYRQLLQDVGATVQLQSAKRLG